MIRFFYMPVNAHGNVEIYDVLNTEPVCIVYESFHSGMAKAITDLLNEKLGPVPTDLCGCGKEKPQMWLHCGCKYNI